MLLQLAPKRVGDIMGENKDPFVEIRMLPAAIRNAASEMNQPSVSELFRAAIEQSADRDLIEGFQSPSCGRHNILDSYVMPIDRHAEDGHVADRKYRCIRRVHGVAARLQGELTRPDHGRANTLARDDQPVVWKAFVEFLP